jgi:phosphoribosylglycinamide formyltransferase 1
MVNISDQIKAGELNASIAVVISSKPGVKGLERAADLQVPAHVVDYASLGGDQPFADAIWQHIRDAKADLICLCGFLRRVIIPDEFHNKVLNIHPGLLPAFGGKGMYGHHVHEAVLAAGCKVSGCTVHFANQEYDKGPILVQRCCPVVEGDTADDLAARVFEEECLAYPQAIKLIADGHVTVEAGNRTRISSA